MMINVFGYQSKELNFLKYLSVKSEILFNVMNIVSQLEDKGLPIKISFCMTESLLLIYNKIHANLFYCVTQCHLEMLHHRLNIWMFKYYNEEMLNMMI